MTNFVGRREFLGTVASAWAGVSAPGSVSLGSAELGESVAAQIQNDYFRVVFDPSSGRLHAWRKDGRPFLSHAVARAYGPWGTRSAADREYTRTVKVAKVRDSLGEGTQLVARCTDSKRQLDFEIHVSIYPARDALVIETICLNSSDKQSLVLQSIEPLRAEFCDGGECHWESASKVLRNGYMYYDAGSVEDFNVLRGHSVQGAWNVALYRDEREEGLVIGFLENNVAEGSIIVAPHPIREHGFSVTAESQYNRDFILKTGARISSGRLIFNLAPDPFTALESYAQAVGDAHQVRLKPIINGWCSWFYTHDRATEAEQLRNAEFIAKHLKPYGMDWVQIDHGYQRGFGNWEANQKYPHGMKWLAQRIREMGLKPGLWVAPFVISKDTDLAKNHPEWLVQDAEGHLQTIIGTYALDVTHPGARQWLYELFRTIADDWGYDFIKIDFVEWSLLAAERYHDASVSKAQAYRLGIETIRSAIGPDRHLLDCGPAQVTTGLLDSTRIELDRRHLTWAPVCEVYRQQQCTRRGEALLLSQTDLD